VFQRVAACGSVLQVPSSRKVRHVTSRACPRMMTCSFKSVSNKRIVASLTPVCARACVCVCVCVCVCLMMAGSFEFVCNRRIVASLTPVCMCTCVCVRVYVRMCV